MVPRREARPGSTFENQEDLVAAAGDAAVTDDLFGIAEAIHLGRVDVAHPEIDATRSAAIASARLPSSMYHVPWPIAGTSRCVGPKRWRYMFMLCAVLLGSAELKGLTRAPVTHEGCPVSAVGTLNRPRAAALAGVTWPARCSLRGVTGQ
jgi:hypothetical protein